MALDRTNMNPEPVSVRRMQSRDVSMALPRSDDGNIHRASGSRDNTSAAHYADAMDSVIGGPSAPGRPLASGR